MMSNSSGSSDTISGDVSISISDIQQFHEEDNISSNYTSPNGTKYWKPICDDELKPHKGQYFKTIDDALAFYQAYGRKGGFDVRKGTEKMHKDGTVTLKHIICSNAGHKQTLVRGGKRKKTRRTVSARCGCKAKLILKYMSDCKAKVGYKVVTFVEIHNHTFATGPGKQFLSITRHMNNMHRYFIYGAARANIGAMKAHSLLKEMVGSYENIGATSVDFKNASRDVKLYIGNHDAQMIVQKFKVKKEINEGYFSDYDVDSNGHLTKLFWADPIGRRNYELFGDAVSFDATFRTNKYNMVFVPFTGIDNHKKCVTFAAGLLSREDIESYKWIFTSFLKAMGRQPILIITDQCPAMKQAIPAVFTSTRHRLCMWHIMKKFSAKVGPSFTLLQDFLNEINAYIWNEDINPIEFEQGWIEVINKFGLNDNEWLSDMYENRRFWIPAYFRDVAMVGMLRTTSSSEAENAFFNQFHKKGDTLCEFFMRFESAMDKQRHTNAKLNHVSLTSKPATCTTLKIEKEASELYTRDVFYHVQKEIVASCYDLTIEGLVVSDGVKIFTVKEKTDRGKIFEVKHNIANDEVDCSCRKFIRMGIQCRHAFVAFNHGEVNKFPKHCLVVRWLKNAEQMLSTTTSSYALKYSNAMITNNTILNELWFEFQDCINLAGLDMEKIEVIKLHLREMKCKMQGATEKSSTSYKNKMIESIFGSRTDDEIVIQLPHESRNKGCGKRIISAAEKSISEGKKRLRTCKLCGQICDHDSRNCPLNKK